MVDTRDRVVVIGGGIGGLTAAALLASSGLDVVLLERAARVGGKMREVVLGGRRVDVGPTVLTMRWVFDEIFASIGLRFEDHVRLRAAETLARHAWPDGATLDLFADVERTADAIGALAGPREADGYRRFCRYAREIFEVVEAPFLRAERPTLKTILSTAGSLGISGLMKIDGHRTLHRALSDFFADERLRQLFGRYATYCGSSPYLAPATLSVIAHVEREGVWFPEGGMYQVAEALAAAATRAGATLRCGAHVAAIEEGRGRVREVVLEGGERIAADAVVMNADPAALRSGLFGQRAARRAPAGAPRSLSAVTWALVAEASGFPLLRHNVFFSGDYEAEFRDLFERDALPRDATVYVCAEDRWNAPSPELGGAGPGAPPEAPAPAPVGERLFFIVNAPATGDTHPPSPSEIHACEQRVFHQLQRYGLSLKSVGPSPVVTTPADFERLFPATGGALYGPASHGWNSPFARAASRSKLRGLYFAGGSVHPGAGVPMAALSGRLAAQSVMEDLASTSRSRTAAMPGGTWMR
ncbi:1-hydroxycarotenoid 3,4-desaturase CrtD [Sorangium cellulosum]|uniref:CrtD protein n=1 Tax=Sorangium cellulosum TaxID=56 RepID=A0A150QH71_SORCE|nr:1-hydroxycarotenoid 3,4-desaturase CrtD [Sorangium cellulosum]KYF67273.1 CrtD protein [Sorangium cellulosum]